MKNKKAKPKILSLGLYFSEINNAKQAIINVNANSFLLPDHNPLIFSKLDFLR